MIPDSINHDIKNDSWHNCTISTPRLVVRAFKPEDAENLFEYLSIKEVYRFEPGEPVDRQQAQELAAEMSTSPDFWAVELQVENRVIGQIYFKQVEPQELMTWELGYILSPHYQRQGYASEAVSALVQTGFPAAGIHRIFAQCNPENIASWKLLEKVGFRREGLLKKNIFFRRDERGEPIWTDTFVYAMLAEENRQDAERSKWNIST
ncbi:MAG: N-acetyltransferase [Chloroflexi bacterium]|nr:MAG: N-acetyltransferase [Chloroflexota bacterium]